MFLERGVLLGPRWQPASSGSGRSRLVQALSSTERSSSIRIVSMERLQPMAAALVCAAAAQVKIWAVGLLGVVACFASRIVRWVQFPHGPPNSPVAYARSIRSAENGESSVQLAGLAPSGNSVMRCIRALGARGLSSILSSPTKVLSARARED